MKTSSFTSRGSFLSGYLSILCRSDKYLAGAVVNHTGYQQTASCQINQTKNKDKVHQTMNTTVEINRFLEPLKVSFKCKCMLKDVTTIYSICLRMNILLRRCDSSLLTLDDRIQIVAHQNNVNMVSINRCRSILMRVKSTQTEAGT